MNWINFKGMDSGALEGLIIRELPPISKPPLRFETTVIDGRDGDITESLGYLAYDRTAKIGLAMDYDINHIIQFFKGKGSAIFSNEPDKVYNCEIFDSINFERLVRFRVADVKFHTQPFKYLKYEPPVILEIDAETELQVTNVGNETSKPIIILYGQGIVTISLNDHAIFQVNIDDEYVVIDSENEEAYNESVLKNRFMVGQFPTLKTGLNVITWTGNLTKIEVQPKSRWL